MNEAIAVVPVLYFAHPVAGRTAEETAGNIARARRWFAWLVERCRDHAFCAPWLPYLEALDETTGRSRGMRDNCMIATRCDGIVLCGGRISSGMLAELGAVLSSEMEPGDATICDLTGLGSEPPQDRDESTVLGISVTTGRVIAFGVEAWRDRDNREELETA